MAKYTALDFAEDILKTATAPMTFQEITEKGKASEYFAKVGFHGKTPDHTVGARLFVDVRDNSKSRFLKVGKAPARFFLKARQKELSEDVITENEHEPAPGKKKALDFEERKLHPLLAYFANTNTEFNRGRGIYTKTIYHEISKKHGLNEWVHPDMVGFYIPIGEWHSKILAFSKASSSNSIRLYSFEIKKTIDRSNYRQCFFQAVSNSSWANEGYLVTAYLEPGDDLYAELERLSVSFGIGLILLDLEDIDSSKVIFPSDMRNELDWELMNKLCEQNTDFEAFIDDVRKDYEVGTIHPSQYDHIMVDDMEEYINKLLK